MNKRIRYYKKVISYLLVLTMLVSLVPSNVEVSKAAEYGSEEISIDLSRGLENAVYAGTTEACIYSLEQGYGYSDNSSDWNDWKGNIDTWVSDTRGVFYISKGGTYRITTGGYNILGNIVVKSSEEITLILDNVNLTGSRSIYRTSPYTNTAENKLPVNMGVAAIDIQGSTVCNIVLEEDSVNTIQGTTYGARMRDTAAISVENLYIKNSTWGDIYDALSTLIISGQGTLNATGGPCSAAIGGNDNRLTGNITINSGNINAISGNWGAAIGDGDTIDSSNGKQYISSWCCQDITVYGESYEKNVHQARIQINGGYVVAKATTATPAIGTSDQLSQASGIQGKEWDGMVIDIEGGTIIAIGGGQHDTAAIGVGNYTKINPANIIVNQNGNTKILALTQQGGYPIIADAYTAGALPAMNGESTSTVINLKFSHSTYAKDIELMPMLGDEYIEDDESFPNNILSTLDISSYGIAVVLNANSYKIVVGEDEENIDIPESGGMIVGSEENGELHLKLPPSITTPNSVVVTQSDTATAQYQVVGTASEGGALTFQWQVSTDYGVNWANIQGAEYATYVNGNTATLSVMVGNSDEKNGYQYRCVLTETINASDIRYATSGAAALTITKEVLNNVTILVWKNGIIWNDNNLKINLYKDGSLYSNATPTYSPAIFETKVQAGKYEIYVGNENTGVTIDVSSMHANSTRIEYYDVSFELEGMVGNNYVSVGASTYVADGIYTIPVMKNKTVTAYAHNTYTTNANGTYLKSDIYSAKDAEYILTDSDKANLLSDNGYAISPVIGQKTVSITYKRQHKAEVDVYLNPSGKDEYSGYLWTDYSQLGAYRKVLRLHSSIDNKEYTLSRVSSGVYMTDEWIFEGDTLDVFADGVDTNLDIRVTESSKRGILRYYTLSYNASGGYSTGLPGTTAYLENTVVMLTDVIPTMEKYKFIGWSDNYLDVISGRTITMTSKTTLYAMWKLEPNEGTGQWKLIDGTEILSVNFNNEINLKGKVYYYDNPNLTNTYYVTGVNEEYLDIEGNGDYYKYNSLVSIKNYGTVDTSEILNSGEVVDKNFESKKVIMGAPEFIEISSQSTFTVTHDTTYFMLKVEGKNSNGEIAFTTYLPIKIEPEVGNVEVRAFQMNTNTAQGAVSEFCPSFRIVSRAGKVMPDKDGMLHKVEKYGTIYALDSKVNSDYNGLMKTNELPDNTGDVRYYEADDVGTLKNWSGSNNDKDKELYNYYALTFMSTSYYLDWLDMDYALTAYAVLDNGEVVYDDNNVHTVSVYDIAKKLYDNKLMATKDAHEFLYDNVLNVVAIKGNEKNIANSVREALGGGKAGTTVYTYANNLYRDLYYYARLAGNYGYEKYSMRGKFTSNTSVGDNRNEELLLAMLNAIDSDDTVKYTSVAHWISENTTYFYKEIPYSGTNATLSGTKE